MSNATSDPADWSNFSHRAAFAGHLPNPFLPTSVAADATVVATVPLAGSGGRGSGSISEQHAGKAPPRKRPRSTRRAPTTMLNTDTTNFRALVQQFTGVSTGPAFSTTYRTVEQPPEMGLSHQQQQQQKRSKRYEYLPPQLLQQQQQQEMMRFSSVAGNGLEECEEMMMQGFFFDGMAGDGQQVIPGEMARGGGGGGGGGYY
ncbi:hypothetical protein KSP39_PZI020441 [Platanthera zijinensis]|uniref:VQ domain-containing protein n=1 Tax=Platanthera zijinensis TaxID=2320716 RepID=A0AAP0AZ66_9ASPA